tara:strand:+ start:343 stop:861 length:519 start_codon:yes stop_codon:yes gene_type:complete
MALGAIKAGLKQISAFGNKATGFATGVDAKGIPGFLKENPMLAIPGLILGAGFVKDAIYDPIAASFTTNSAEDMQEFAAMNADIAFGMQQRQEQAMKIQKETAKQAASLAAVAPHLYNQILAGRTLPQGALVLGGTPRTDLMEQLAFGMASGKFNQPDSDTSMLAAMASGQL